MSDVKEAMRRREGVGQVAHADVGRVEREFVDACGERAAWREGFRPWTLAPRSTTCCTLRDRGEEAHDRTVSIRAANALAIGRGDDGVPGTRGAREGHAQVLVIELLRSPVVAELVHVPARLVRINELVAKLAASEELERVAWHSFGSTQHHDASHQTGDGLKRDGTHSAVGHTADVEWSS